MDRTSTTLEDVLSKLTDSHSLRDLIKHSKLDEREQSCNGKSAVISEHQGCYAKLEFEDHDQLAVAKCHRAILLVIVKCIASKPTLFDDEVKKQLAKLFKSLNLKADGLVNEDILQILNKQSDSQIITWIKYESFLVHLIKELIYEPKTMADEILQLAKKELEPHLAAKFSPVLNSCAKVCREVSAKYGCDEEVEEKWGEIIDWMGWFLSGEDNDM